MNKPVAYEWEYVASSNEENLTEIVMPTKKWEELKSYVDTHPVKELTDEEILSVFVENYGDDILPNIQTSGIEFAKAILRKAQEK